MADNRIWVVVTAQDEASAEIERLKSRISELKESVGKNTASVRSSMDGITSSIRGVVAGAVSVAGAMKAISSAADFEQTSIAFQTMLGDVGQAKALLQQLSDFAAATPFEFPEIANAGKQLLAFGVTADQIKWTLTTLGDIASGVSVPIGQLTAVFGQVRAAGKLMGQDLLQFTSAGIPIIEALANTMGKSSSEIKGMVEKGKVGFADVQRALESLTAEGGKFHGMMAKQSTSLGGLWSTLSDTLGNLSRNIVGISSTGEVRIGSLFEKLRTWASSLIQAIGDMTPAIIDFTNDLQTYFSIALSAIGDNWKASFDLISETLPSLASLTRDSTLAQSFHWRDLFGYMAAGMSIVSMGYVSTLKVIGAIGKTLITGLRVTAEEFAGFVVLTIAALLSPVQNAINYAIDGVNLFRKAMGLTAIDGVKFADNLWAKAVKGMKESWQQGGEEISGAWDSAMTDIQTAAGRTDARLKEIAGSIVNGYSAGAAPALKAVAPHIEKLWTASWDAKKSAKEHAEELKKMKDAAEESIKPAIERMKDNKKAIDDAKKSLKEKSDEWKKYRSEGMKALSDVNAEIAKVKSEAADIRLKFSVDRDSRLAERSVEVMDEIKKANEEIANLKADVAKEDDPEKQKQLVETQKSLVALEKEREYIKSNAPQKALDEAKAYASLSEAEKIVVDLRKEEGRAIEDNSKKLAALAEKKMVLEAQANQQNVNDLRIHTGMKDGIMTASIEVEKGKRVELHDQEAINMANDIAAKQLAMKTEAEDLSRNLAAKLEMQRGHIQATSSEYSRFYEFLKTETKQSAASMIVSLNSVNAALRETISLRAKVGFSSTSATAASNVSGARALWGPVDSGKTYLVGENGPELFTPERSGTVVRNGSFGGSANISISLGGVVVREAADIDRIVSKVSEELSRKMDLYRNYWIA